MPDGAVLISNGIDEMLRFDPSVGAVETAGIVAPTTKVAVNGVGAGNIVGEFYAHVRYVDRHGYFSSLSPISDLYIASYGSFSLTAATNATPIVVTTSAAHGLGNGQQIRIEGVMGNDGANGIFITSAVTSTTITLKNLDGSDTVGTGTYNSGGSLTSGVALIRYTNVPTTTEARVTRRQILRSRTGDLTVFYVDIDTDDLTSTTFDSAATNDDLLDGVALVDDLGDDLSIRTPPETFRKFVAHHLGRMFAAGIEPYSEGAVSVTNGSKTVTGIGTEWGRVTFPGRYIDVVGGNKSYEIYSVESTTSLTLVDAYSGTTDEYAYYTIHPGAARRREFVWSRVGEPEAFPAFNSAELEQDIGAGELTGLMPMNAFLYILAENRIYRFSFVNNPISDGFSVKASSRGCVNNRCHIRVDEAAYMLDYVGFHVFYGNEDAAIGSQEVQDLFRRGSTGKYRINWRARRYFHAVYDPGEATVRWFLCMGGSYTPYHAVAYNVRLKRWWIEEYPFPISASCLGRYQGNPQVYLASDAQRIFALHQSTLDGIKSTGATIRGTVTSSGVDWIADSTASFPTTTAGTYLYITQGKGKGQRNRIVSISGTTVNVLHPWLIRPDTTSTYQIGGVAWSWKSRWMMWGDEAGMAQRAVALSFRPLSAQAQMYLRVYEDLSGTAQAWERTQTLAYGNGIALLADDPTTDLSIDCTKSNGRVTHRLPDFAEWYTDGPRYVSIELSGTQNTEQQAVFSVAVDGAG
jgi:hypothetical protein